jgi:CBS domain-containing protein
MAELTVGDIMDRDPETVSPRTDVSTLIRVLQENELPSVPVVAEGHNRVPVVEGPKLVGVVTRVDALNALTRAGE